MKAILHILLFFMLVAGAADANAQVSASTEENDQSNNTGDKITPTATVEELSEEDKKIKELVPPGTLISTRKYETILEKQATPIPTDLKKEDE